MPSLMKLLFVAFTFVAAVASAIAHDSEQEANAPDETASDKLIHTIPGTPTVGTAPDSDGTFPETLSVRVLDSDTGAPTFCRVAVRDAQGRYYEPSKNPLAPWSLHRLGNRTGKGPFRYYGWFFYTSGEFDVHVPRGDVVVEVWKGYEHRPIVQRVEIVEGEPNEIELTLRRVLDMAARNWYSGDTHIHLNRRNVEDESRALDLLEAEDLRFGYLLAMNDTRTYTGDMAAQEWPQDRGLGRSSIVRRGDTWLSSGQEYRCSTYGHICVLLADELVFNNESLNPNEWPLFDKAGIETHRLNGKSFHAHGGYEKEIYADFVHGNTDGVELLQFAVYRGIGLEGWYHMLNAGYRFPAIGASDYPYCRAFGDCRTYVRLEDEVSVEAWTDAAAEGRSFFTTGPMLLLDVEGVSPGSTLAIDADRNEVRVRIEVMTEVAPVQQVDVLVNGSVAHSFAVKSNELPQSLRYEMVIPCEKSMWVSARAWGEQLEGHPDADAHTNPVYITFEGTPIRSTNSIRWLIQKVGERLEDNSARSFSRRDDVVTFFEHTKTMLEKQLESIIEESKAL